MNLFKAMYKKLLMKFMQTKLYYSIVMKIIPYLRISFYYTSIRGWKYYVGYKLLQPGDLILSIDRHKITTLLITGHLGRKASTAGKDCFTHASFCVGKDCNWEVSEMTHTNYTKSTFFDICKEADRVVILTSDLFDESYRQKMVARCKSYDGCQYDTQFHLDSFEQRTINKGLPALACSELVYESDFERRMGVSLEDTAGLGTPYVTPTGIFLAKNVKVKWDSDNEVNPFG